MCEATWVLGGQEKITSLMRTIVRESLERSSVRILARRYSLGKMKIMKIIHTVTAQTKDSLWMTKRFQPSWSGLLVFDGKSIKAYDVLATKLKEGAFSEHELKYLHKKVWLCGIDAGTGDLPHYDLADEETKIDLILYFQVLKKIGYVLRCLVCDGNNDIVSAARKVFGESFLVQRCTRHFIELLKRKAQEMGLWEDPATLSCIRQIQSVIEAETLEMAHDQLLVLQHKRLRHSGHRVLIELFKQQADELTTHLRHPELTIPHTTNEIENLFRQLNLRLTSLGRFGHWRYARDYLKAWALLRRFTPYTDCRGPRRCRNHKAPLELAGCNIKKIDFLRL